MLLKSLLSIEPYNDSDINGFTLIMKASSRPHFRTNLRKLFFERNVHTQRAQLLFQRYEFESC